MRCALSVARQRIGFSAPRIRRLRCSTPQVAAACHAAILLDITGSDARWKLLVGHRWEQVVVTASMPANVVLRSPLICIITAGGPHVV